MEARVTVMTARVRAMPTEAGRRRAGMRLDIQQAADALEENAATGGGHEAGHAAEFFQSGEGGDIEDAVATDGSGNIIAAVLALLPNLPGEPPRRGVIEEECFQGSALHEVGDVIPAAEMEASSWARRASNCAAASLARAKAGTRMTGRKPPTMQGTSTAAVSSRRKARWTPTRRARSTTRACRLGEAG